MNTKSANLVGLSEPFVQSIMKSMDLAWARKLVTPHQGQHDQRLLHVATEDCVGCIDRLAPVCDQLTLNDSLEAAVRAGNEHAVQHLIQAGAGAWEGYETYVFPGGDTGRHIEDKVVETMLVRTVCETYVRAVDQGEDETGIEMKLRAIRVREKSWAGKAKAHYAQNKKLNRARKNARKASKKARKNRRAA